MSFCRVISTYYNVLKLVNNEKEIYVMSKFSRLFLITMMLMILSIPLLNAQADEKVERWEEWPTYYSLTDPGNAEPPAAPWIPTPAEPAGIIVPAGTDIWFGTENLFIEPNMKFYRLSLTGAGLASLADPWARGYDPVGAEMEPIAGPKMFFVGGTLNIDVVFDPQPEWEVVRLTTTAVVTINNAVGASGCTKVTDVPSLTTFGIIALALLLIASTIWIMRKKRAGVQI